MFKTQLLPWSRNRHTKYIEREIERGFFHKFVHSSILFLQNLRI